MDLLVLGGTRFLGRHFTELALAADHEVTLFNRGKTEPELFPEADRLEGDRLTDISALKDGTWDAVVDTSGYHPQAVRASAELLSGRADHYTFISTISVYADLAEEGFDEDAPTMSLGTEASEDIIEITEETYGPLKAASERAARRAFEGDVLVLRPGLIVGPYDPTERFTYWPRRMDRGGEVLAPGKPHRQVQLIDVRDLASWMLGCIERGRSGTFNATGPDKRMTMETVLADCAKAVEAEVEFTWVEDDFLLEAGVQPWTGLPLWLPEAHNGLLDMDIERALDAGLEFRPLEETARDTLEWDQERGARIHRAPAIDPARELALLQAYAAQRG